MSKQQSISIRNRRSHSLVNAAFFAIIILILVYKKVYGQPQWITSNYLFWPLLIFFLSVIYFYIYDFRKQPVQIELNSDGIRLIGRGNFKWTEIADIQTDKDVEYGINNLRLTLQNGKIIKFDIADLNTEGEELMELIGKWKVQNK